MSPANRTLQSVHYMALKHHGPFRAQLEPGLNIVCHYLLLEFSIEPYLTIHFGVDILILVTKKSGFASIKRTEENISSYNWTSFPICIPFYQSLWLHGGSGALIIRTFLYFVHVSTLMLRNMKMGLMMLES